VVILLDGEGIIFKDEFLQQGEEGGRNAAKQLSTALNTYLTTNLSNINVPKLLTKIYMNVRVFGEMCTRSGIVADPSGIHDFIRGFNETMSFSEIVDIGSAKNTVLDKMKGKLAIDIMETVMRIPELMFLAHPQRPSKSSSTTAIATRSSWAARQIPNTQTFWRIY